MTTDSHSSADAGDQTDNTTDSEGHPQPVMNDEMYAWRVLLDPSRFDSVDRTYLFVRGQEHYRDETGKMDRQRFLSDVQDFAIAASHDPDHEDIVNDPWLSAEEPGRLALMYAASALAMRHSTEFDVPPPKIALHEYAEEALIGCVCAALDRHPQRGTLQQLTAEAVFAREQEDDLGPPPGRAVTDIVQMDTGNWYFTVPMVHASRYLISEDRTAGEPVDCFVDNNLVYVPMSKVDDKLDAHLTRGSDSSAKLLRSCYRRAMPTENKERFLANVTRLNDTIRKLKQTNKTHKLYVDQRYPQRLRCILKAVHEAPEELAVLDSRLAAGDILNAIEWFGDQVPSDADHVDDDANTNPAVAGWEQRMLEEFSTPQGVSQYLREHADNAHVDHIQRDHPQPDQFDLEYHSQDFKQIDVTDPDDIFELPCFANLEESFMQGQQDRYPLYQMVRVIASLENEFSPDEICTVFERFPWYKPDVTEYQVKYELRQTLDDGLPPNPIGCNNDSERWGDFCIGKEQCDYSIYGSLPFKRTVYNRLDSD